MLPLEDMQLLQNTLTSVNIDPDTIAGVRDLLMQNVEAMTQSPVMGVKGTAFGDSSTGGYRLATNADLAHKAVVEEMEKMVAGLRKYRDDIALLAKEVEESDAMAQARMDSIATATECVAAPTFDGGQCTIPTDSTGD